MKTDPVFKNWWRLLKKMVAAGPKLQVCFFLLNKNSLDD